MATIKKTLCQHSSFVIAKLLTLFCLITLVACVTHSPVNMEKNNVKVEPEKPDILFIAYDYGESMAFESVLSELASSKINVRVLVFGAAENALKSAKNTIRLESFFTSQEKRKYADILKKLRDHRDEALPTELLEKVTNQLKPALVVTGMASGAQARLTGQMALSGAYAIAFYDNFDVPENQAFIKPWLMKIPGVNEVFLPGDYLINSFLKIKALSGSEITVTGQPALESWLKSLQKIDKSQVLSKAGIHDRKPVVIFAAGYDKGSVQALKIFLDSAPSRPDIHFIISPHPKTRGDIDKMLENKIQKAKNVQMAPEHLSTEELTRVASAVVTHKSTVGMKAACADIPVIYVADNTYDNILTVSHYAERASSWSEIMNALHNVLDRNKSSPGVCKKLGMPSHPVTRFTQRLKEVLSQIKNSSKLPVVEHMEFKKTQDLR